jgi:hypothetical protein
MIGNRVKNNPDNKIAIADFAFCDALETKVVVAVGGPDGQTSASKVYQTAQHCSVEV